MQKELGEYEDALQNLRLVVEQEGEQEDLFYHFALAAYGAGELEIALGAFDVAYKLRPDDPEMLKNIGKISFELGEYQQSVDHFDDYLRIFGENAQVWAFRGNAYYAL